MTSTSPSMACTTTLTRGSCLSAPSPRPNNNENTRICRMSLRAIASSRLFGNACSTMSLKLSPAVLRPVFMFSPLAVMCNPLPGCSTLANSRPSISETSEAHRNQTTVRTPMRPTFWPSSMPASPETSVANTSGAMIISMSRRKISVMIEKYPAIALAWAGSVAPAWHAYPATTPSTIPAAI